MPQNNNLSVCTIRYGFSDPDRDNDMCQTSGKGSTNSSLNAISIPHLHEKLSRNSEFCFSVTAILGPLTISVEGVYVQDSLDATNGSVNSGPTANVNNTSENIAEHGALIVTVVASSLCLCAMIVVFIAILVPLTVVIMRRRQVQPKCKDNVAYQ